MRAATFYRYGDINVLNVEEIESPQPGPDEILIRNFASTVMMGDCELRSFKVAPWIWLPLRIMLGIFRPRFSVLGQDYSGIIEQVGTNVTAFSPGDEVMAPCDMKFGGHAQYVVLHRSKPIVRKPAKWSYQEAATLPTSGLNALHLYDIAKTSGREKVLIIGGGGSIGTYLIQLLKNKGSHVTVIDHSSKADFLSEAGADQTIHFDQVEVESLKESFDVVIDIFHTTRYRHRLHLASRTGTYIVANPRLSSMFLQLYRKLFRNKNWPKIRNALAPYTKELLQQLADLAHQKLLSSKIDRTFTIDQIKEAHEYVESGMKKGHVVVDLT